MPGACGIERSITRKIEGLLGAEKARPNETNLIDGVGTPRV
jgi:hypothetical protein